MKQHYISLAQEWIKQSKKEERGRAIYYLNMARDCLLAASKIK